MPSRLLALCTLATIALLGTTANVPPATAHTVGPATAAQSPPDVRQARSAPTRCYDQLDNDTGITIVSQNFEPEFDAYDSQGADDFALSKTCKVKTVTVIGTYFNGDGPAQSFNVAIYRHGKGGIPGRVCRLAPHIRCEKVDASYQTNADLSWTIDLGTTWKLAPGRYWLSVQMNMDFSSSGEGGMNTSSVVHRHLAVWRNPGDGFSTGCIDWTPLLDCINAFEGGDFVFAIN